MLLIREWVVMGAINSNRCINGSPLAKNFLTALQ